MDTSFMFKVNAKDLCFPDVKVKAKEALSPRTFQGLLPTQWNNTSDTQRQKTHFTQLFKTHHDDDNDDC